MVIAFPAYRPSSWELQIPNYPVIANNWRSTELPEILGSLPEDSRLRLTYRNVSSAEALQLLLSWRASAGGFYPLSPLPAEIAAGIDNAAIAGQILNVGPLVWVVAESPTKESIKNQRFTVNIELKTELRATSASPILPVAPCPIIDVDGGLGTIEPFSILFTIPFFLQVSAAKKLDFNPPINISIDIDSPWTAIEKSCSTGSIVSQTSDIADQPTSIYANVKSIQELTTKTTQGISPCGSGANANLKPAKVRLIFSNGSLEDVVGTVVSVVSDSEVETIISSTHVITIINTDTSQPIQLPP